MTTSPGSGTTASASRGSEDLGLDGRVSSVNSARQAVGPAAAAVLAAAAAAAAAQQPRTPDQKHQQHQLPAGAGVERSSGSGTTLDGNGVIKRSKEQEKNRRAQARFRERQKVLPGLMSACSEHTSKFNDKVHTSSACCALCCVRSKLHDITPHAVPLTPTTMPLCRPRTVRPSGA